MAGQIYLPPAGAAKPEIRHTAYRYPLWRSHAFAHSQRQRLSGRQLRHYAQDCRMAAGMGQTTRLQYQLHMETAKQPVARPASLAVGDTHQIQNQLCRRRARDVPGLTTTGTATTSAGCMAAQEHAPARKTACPIPTAASIPAKAKPCMPPTTATVLPFPIK